MQPPGSNWSAVNVAKVDALLAAGRMQPPGLFEVDAAKADDRWDQAVGREWPPTVDARSERFVVDIGLDG